MSAEACMHRFFFNILYQNGWSVLSYSIPQCNFSEQITHQHMNNTMAENPNVLDNPYNWWFIPIHMTIHVYNILSS